MWAILQIGFGVLGVLLVLGGDRLSMPILLYGGMACFGLTAMTIGWEAIITRQIRLGTRRKGTRETYIGFPAILQGIQFNLLGIFLIGLAAFSFVNERGNIGRELFLQFVRRPGIPLVVIGLLMLIQSLVMFLGYQELKQGPGWMTTINLLLSRMLPGVILLGLGLGALGLGVLEIIAPAVFDSMGGGFLEKLYQVRK
jgi:hypothetical protein